MICFDEFLQNVNEYRAKKGRDPLTPGDFAPDPMAASLKSLDLLIRERHLLLDKIYLNASENPHDDEYKADRLEEEINELKEWICLHPESKWTMEVLDYRIRQEHYK